MKIYKNISDNIPEGSVVSVGFFDGVHLGHKYLIEKLKDIGKQYNSPTMIITMWPHPLTILKNQNIKLLTSQDEKNKIFEKMGIDTLLILNFNKELASINARNFIDGTLTNNIKAKVLLKGFNNSFGKDAGNNFIPDTERIKIITADKFLLNNSVSVNSTKIRNYLDAGDIKSATELLGYNYKIKGTIKEAYKIGRKIGFPTANLTGIDKNKLIPGNGVYIIQANINDNWLPAMLNIGNRPTFGHFDKTLEFHILDFNDKIYNKKIEIRFLKKLRDEKKFDNVHCLIKQLKQDKKTTKDYFC